MFTCASAGVNGAVTTVAVEKNAAAARDVIAIRFNMTCLLLRGPMVGTVLVKGITQATPEAFPGRPEEFSRSFGRFLAMVRFPRGNWSARSAGFWGRRLRGNGYAHLLEWHLARGQSRHPGPA